MHRTRRSNLPLESIRCDDSLLVRASGAASTWTVENGKGRSTQAGKPRSGHSAPRGPLLCRGLKVRRKQVHACAGHRLEWLQCVSLLSDRSRVAKGRRRKFHGKNEKENDMHCNPSPHR